VTPAELVIDYGLTIDMQREPTEEVTMKTNAELQRDVLDELLSDPSINAANVQVIADHGSVTLGGSIASYTEKWEAKRAAQRVRGVGSIVNNLDVKLPGRR
jgi:osmotically-inducible protein OsmY